MDSILVNQGGDGGGVGGLKFYEAGDAYVLTNSHVYF